MKTTKTIIIVVLLLAVIALTLYVVFSRKKLKTIIGGYKEGDRMSTMYSSVKYNDVDFFYSVDNGWISDSGGVTGEHKLTQSQIEIEKFTFKYDSATKDYILVK